jgi:hypothetical protein
MRSSPLHLILVVSCAMPALTACGGGTPPPKDENAAAEHASAKSDTDTKPSTESSAAAPSTPASEPETPVPAKSSSVDLVAPAADDPWMAPHQMPASDVIKTMKAAKGKVNVCWHQAQKRDPSVSGDVKIKFVISHEGSVIVWRNEDSTASDGDAIKCVGEVIKALKFPLQKAPGTAWGLYEINFGG